MLLAGLGLVGLVARRKRIGIKIACSRMAGAGRSLDLASY
jgi:hypothetical protein